ncbi:MAG: DNA repair protein RadC [Lachnospiraceae bacterium]|nr:DNA repair protein RadC [Lachnospiraceae bacterium]MDD7177042.1 DNA repair protein RadC [bacterium]MDY5517790.1 DNA repair protein RadC [Lachnospiraceae bacterium]
MTQHMTARELPVSERPYEKCLLAGPQALSDAELLAVILKSGSRQMNVISLAQNILQADGKDLLNLYHMSVEELMRFPGIGKVKAIQLKCVAELSRRIARTDRRERIRLSDAASVADYYMEYLRHESQEQLLVSMFDSKCHLISDAVIATGSVRAVLGSPREIFLRLFEKKAVSFILLHNHPSGDPAPSREDFALTRRILECGELMDIELVDHIIIGDNRYYSFRENKQIFSLGEEHL